MGDELPLLLEIFNKIEKAGGQATLCVATGGGKTKVKLEITTTPAPPTGSTPTSSGRRQRRRGPRARARRNQRAAAHQAALAEAAATSAPLRSPTPRLLPSPPPESGRRLVTAVARPDMPTFSTLNVDGHLSPPPPPTPPPTSPTPPPPTSPTPQSSSLQPPLCFINCGKQDHCEDCGRCEELCVDHHGCFCAKEDFDFWEYSCVVCNCEIPVKYQMAKWSVKWQPS